MPPTLLLIPSPLLGPATWEPAARAVEQLGRSARVADLRAVAGAEPPYWPAGVEAIVEAAAGDPVILVPHSNSGLYAPAVADALGERVRGVVFVDAAFPGAGSLTPRDQLAGLAGEDGRLPPWTSWWPEEAVAELFPDAAMRARVEAEQSRLPLAYYDNLPPAPDGWDRPPCAYLWFGEPYGAGARRAAGRGWPTAHLPGTHLHMLFDPAAVAAEVLRQAERMG